jgi:hypothetical protein
MREENDLEDEVLQNKTLNVIKKGLEIRDPGCGEFWEDFMSICADASAVAELLDVPSTKVAKWASIIRDKIQEVENDNSKVADNKSKVLSTGNEPVANPDGADTSFDGPADTRPMP